MSNSIKWRSVFVLAFMIYAVLFQQSWPWGLLFLFWTWPSIQEGHLYLGDDLYREDDPILFWFSSLFILGLCAWLVVADLLPPLEFFS
ncbi:hypothetical protein QMT40_001240 [Parvibaculaceae bacterium PLY_AMNH_Bact1]|nr:hypothetical protein QMT40_001240 [Parvibaculaceae bacterium PLY_AMNH_Bact1]